MANQQLLEGSQIHDREKEILMDICEKVGCVFAQASLGICFAKYGENIYLDFDVADERNCETACIPINKNNENVVRPARVSINGHVEYLSDTTGKVVSMENPGNYKYESVATKNRFTNASMGIVRFMGIRK